MEANANNSERQLTTLAYYWRHRKWFMLAPWRLITGR